MANPPKSSIFRPVSYNANLDLGKCSTEERGGTEKDLQAFARIKPADGQNGELACVRNCAGAEQPPPGVEFYQFRHDHRVLCAIKFFQTLGAVPAYRYDQRGAARMLGFKPRLKGHAHPRDTALKRDGVSENSLDARDVRCRLAPAGDGVSIGVNANSRISAEPLPAQCFIKEYTSGCIDRRNDTRGDHSHTRSEVAKTVNQGASSDVTSAAAPDIRGNSRDELQMIHERPTPVGFLLTPLNRASETTHFGAGLSE